jgi:hypothetical protein
MKGAITSEESPGIDAALGTKIFLLIEQKMATSLFPTLELKSRGSQGAGYSIPECIIRTLGEPMPW